MKRFFVFVLLMVLCGCGRLDELPIFDRPMPASKNESISIDKKFNGVYASLTDSAFLVISTGEIIIKDFYNEDISRVRDSQAHEPAKDSIVQEPISSMTVHVRKYGVYQHSSVDDTLFFASDNYKLKKHKGFYFANKKLVNGKWVVRTLRMTDHGILVSRLRSRDEIENLEDYSSSEPDSLSNKKQISADLKAFLQNDRYSDERKFVRVKMSKF